MGACRGFSQYPQSSTTRSLDNRRPNQCIRLQMRYMPSISSARNSCKLTIPSLPNDWQKRRSKRQTIAPRKVVFQALCWYPVNTRPHRQIALMLAHPPHLLDVLGISPNGHHRVPSQQPDRANQHR